MFIGKSYEVDPLTAEEIREYIQGFDGVTGVQRKGRRTVLRPGPLRQVWPQNPIPLAVDAHFPAVSRDNALAIDDFPPVSRIRHLREFEGGIYGL